MCQESRDSLHLKRDQNVCRQAYAGVVRDGEVEAASAGNPKAGVAEDGISRLGDRIGRYRLYFQATI